MQEGNYTVIHARFPPNGEGMWVKVEHEMTNEAEGTLENIPIDSPNYTYGQRVKLKRDNIIEGWYAI
jgi:hypothetical protein